MQRRLRKNMPKVFMHDQKGAASKKKKVSLGQSSKICDVTEPEKPLTAFKMYSSIKSDILKRRHPTWQTNQLAKKVKKCWKKSEHRALYEKMAREQLDQYQAEMMVFYARTSQFAEVLDQAQEWLEKIR
jgi:hypothetical protein